MIRMKMAVISNSAVLSEGLVAVMMEAVSVSDFMERVHEKEKRGLWLKREVIPARGIIADDQIIRSSETKLK
jgi:hypothetical protein